VDRKVELLTREDAAWTELHELIRRFDADQFERPGLTDEGWSVKDMCWHIGCWCAYAMDELEQIHMGTYEDVPIDVEDLNRQWFEISRGLDARTVCAEFHAARTRLLDEWHGLPELTPIAVEWFEESSHLHYREHLKDLTAWLESLADGSASG
jgi:hypothetical protein